MEPPDWVPSSSFSGYHRYQHVLFSWTCCISCASGSFIIPSYGIACAFNSAALRLAAFCRVVLRSDTSIEQLAAVLSCLAAFLPHLAAFLPHLAALPSRAFVSGDVSSNRQRCRDCRTPTSLLLQYDVTLLLGRRHGLEALSGYTASCSMTSPAR